ncbi:MAG: hypothetical protein ABR577_00855 [Pyrinomonadaceae bacterium]
MRKVEPEIWREEPSSMTEETSFRQAVQTGSGETVARDETRLFDLLGRINYRILRGDVIYIQIEGINYKVLYCGYWRSIYTGVSHYLLRCKEIKEGMWMHGDPAALGVDIPIYHSPRGWLAGGHPLRALLFRELSFL